MKTHDIRAAYLSFFAAKGHEILPSASLLPDNDPTTLFTGSGMQPMVPYLLGAPHPRGNRLTDSQKCFRAQDIEEVGDNRHMTFFEMLGNWSLGDYFKEEQISWMFEFLTREIGLSPACLYITCFRGNEQLGIPKDEASAQLWQKEFKAIGIEAKIVDFPEQNGMQGGRIFYYDEKKNWWSRAGVPGNMPLGEPGGPDTEMFWDFASSRGDLHLNDTDTVQFGALCHVNCDCGRFMEIGNNVFMQYKKTDAGFEPLPQKNVDFGGGLERIAAAYTNNPDVFHIDLFDESRAMLERVSGKTYGADVRETYAMRVVLDHLRAATFLIADGAIPSNKDQGYFTRRLIRRAVRYGKTLGIQGAFCVEISRTVIAAYVDAYEQLKKHEETIISEMQKEEQKFANTIEQGMKKF